MTSKLKGKLEAENIYLHMAIQRLNERIQKLESRPPASWIEDACALLEAIQDETDRAPCAIKTFQPSLNRNEWVSVAAMRLLAEKNETARP